MLTSFHSFNISKPFMIGAFITALLIHTSLLPISNLITIKQEKNVEPKLVLELTNDMELTEPIKPIEKPIINNNIPPAKPEQIEQTIKPNLKEQIINKNIDIRNLNLYSKSYINHLINSNEILASMILTLYILNK